ncbi:hypothetical protein [Phenylobacterium sp.]|uniref:hypothetical protein n=1 Tax=Phenylobacterium sp. TaxID=1871053 RepID=UPI002B70FD3B|nr:hypothetical protein [Phenylobacterium sp.]HVI34410.1 hypothetical protein [Phenylobacterium sp.]
MRIRITALALALCLAPGLALAEPSAVDVRARYCLDVLDLHDGLARNARPSAEADALLGSTRSQRREARRRIERYLASRRLGPADAEALKRARSEDLAADLTDLIFVTPDPGCRASTAGHCRIEAWMQADPRRRHAQCSTDLSWLPEAPGRRQRTR